MTARRSFYLKLGGTGALLLILLLRVDVGQVFRAFGQFGAATWLVNLSLYFAAWALAAVKWKTLLPQYSVRSLFALNFIAQYYSTLLPGQLAGEVVKAYRLGRGKQDAEQIAASVIIDRITGLIGLLAVAFGGMLLSRSVIDARITAALGVFCTGLLVGLFCFKFAWWLRIAHAAASLLGPFAAQATRLIESWRRYLEQPGVLLLSVVFAAGFQLTAVWINVLFARELGVEIVFADWCWLFGVISVITMLPFTVGGIGLREGSFVGALALFGVPAEKSIAISFAIFGLLLAGAAIGAALEWSQGGDRKSSIATS